MWIHFEFKGAVDFAEIEYNIPKYVFNSVKSPGNKKRYVFVTLKWGVYIYLESRSSMFLQKRKKDKLKLIPKRDFHIFCKFQYVLWVQKSVGVDEFTFLQSETSLLRVNKSHTLRL